jgi:hypothetical protein
MGKEDMMFVLEMVIQTAGGMVNEPIGIYDTEEQASEWLEEASKVFNSTVVLNVLPVACNVKPPILDIESKAKNTTGDLMVGLELYELYEAGIIQQMVDEDGCFSYQLSNKHQATLEKFISRGFEI